MDPLGFLRDALEPKTVEIILNHPKYTLEGLCKIIPSICGEEDADDQWKLTVLSLNPSFFFSYAKDIDVIPDLRLISEETRRSMKIEKWNPWKTLSEELANLMHASDRSDDTHLAVFRFFANKTRGPHIFEVEAKRCFIITYPALGYLLLHKENNWPWAVLLDHPAVMNMRKGSVYYACLSQRQEVVDWILEGQNPQTILKKYTSSWEDNKYVVEWLIERVDDQFIRELHRSVCFLDDLDVFKRLYKPKEWREWIDDVLDSGREKILKHIVSTLTEEDKEDMEKYLVQFLSLGRWNRIIIGVLKGLCGIRRFYATMDILREEIIEGDLECVNEFVNAGGDIETPILWNDDMKLSPLLYAYQMQKINIANYLLPLYQTTPERLLLIASLHRLEEATITLLTLHKFDKETLVQALALSASRDGREKTNRRIIECLTKELDERMEIDESSLSPIIPLQ